MKDSILDSISEELFSTLPLIDRSIRRKLFKTAQTGFRADITPPHTEIMRLLKDEGTLHAAEIGKRLQIARPQMTHLIDKLVDLGVADRQADTEDRRTINITLTDNGKMVLAEHDRRIINAAMETLAPLTYKELEELSEVLKKLKEIFLKIQAGETLHQVAENRNNVP